MRPKVKYAVIHRHRNDYPIAVMCKFFGVSRSGYYDFMKRLGWHERDADLSENIKECQVRQIRLTVTDGFGSGCRTRIFKEIRKPYSEL